MASLMFPLFLTLSGCHSHYVQTTIVNQGMTAVRNIEVDYPSASFGLPALPPGGRFAYRFQIQGAGHLQLLYVDSTGKSHTVQGPYVAEDQEGALHVNIGGDPQNIWQAQLKPEVTAPKE